MKTKIKMLQLCLHLRLTFLLALTSDIKDCRRLWLEVIGHNPPRSKPPFIDKVTPVIKRCSKRWGSINGLPAKSRQVELAASIVCRPTLMVYKPIRSIYRLQQMHVNATMLHDFAQQRSDVPCQHTRPLGGYAHVRWEYMMLLLPERTMSVRFILQSQSGMV